MIGCTLWLIYFVQRYYDNEYDFQRDVYGIIRATHDVHLFYVPNVIGLFTFERQLGSVPYQIYSVSKDGVSLPNIYAFTDQDALTLGNASHYAPSPITTIDGQAVEPYLNSIAAYEPLGVGFIFGDPDASYNALFPNLPNTIALGVYEAADCRFFYTPAMYSSQEAVWNKAYELMWKNGTGAKGSTGQGFSEPGTGYILSPFPFTAKTWNTPENVSGPNTSGADYLVDRSYSITAILGLACLLLA